MYAYIARESCEVSREFNPFPTLVLSESTRIFRTVLTPRRASRDRPIGPGTSSVVLNGTTPAVGYRPCDGRKPQIPQHSAGVRREPIVSEPKPTGAMLAAIPAAVPAELRRELGARVPAAVVVAALEVGARDDDRRVAEDGALHTRRPPVSVG